MPTCNICKREFENLKDLLKHLVKEHAYGANEIYKEYNYSFETKEATCPICGKHFIMSNRQLRAYSKGISKAIACSKLCSMSFFNIVYGNPSTWEGVNEKKKKTYLKHFGVEHISQLPEIKEQVNKKLEETNLRVRGVRRPIQSCTSFEKMKETNLKRYGSEYSISAEQAKEKAKQTNLERYGFENAYQNKDVQERAKETNLQRYGFKYASQSPEILERIREANLERHQVEYFCQHEKCSKANGFRISKVNRKFHEILDQIGIENELEYIIENSGYDLKVGNTLIEIDPYFTHNTTVGPCFSNKRRDPLSEDYHYLKTSFAKEHGFHCIHVFDWDEWEKIIYLLQPKENVYARECEVRSIDRREAREFLDTFHLQGATKQSQYAYGLYHNEELVQVMTFGKPRYNKNYEYELLRLCSNPNYTIVGGASRLLKHFEMEVNPRSIISYCDLSKFNGSVYYNLGFKLQNQTEPARHWYNPKTKRHITDNLLRQRGFDQLHKANFGKGTSNEELMREHGYVEIYDCGQLVFAKSY